MCGSCFFKFVDQEHYKKITQMWYFRKCITKITNPNFHEFHQFSRHSSAKFSKFVLCFVIWLNLHMIKNEMKADICFTLIYNLASLSIQFPSWCLCLWCVKALRSPPGASQISGQCVLKKKVEFWKTYSSSSARVFN